MKLCLICRFDFPTENFYQAGSGRLRPYCKSCDKARTIAYPHRIKRERVAALGGECCRCGYNRSLNALDFHHRDPSTKKFSLASGAMRRRPIAEVEAELEKCDLLCSNCHREVHEVGFEPTALRV